MMEAQAAAGWLAEMVAPHLNEKNGARYAEAVAELVREEGVRSFVGAPRSSDYGGARQIGTAPWSCRPRRMRYGRAPP